MAEFPIAPNQLPTEMHDLLDRVAHLWANHPDRPRPKLEILDHWDRLIPEWAADPSLPLFVRKTAKNRGHVLHHPSGRSIVPSDNSPAHWAFAAAVLGQTPTPDDIRGLLARDQVPVAMAFGKEERQRADYRCSLRDVVSPNAAGWTVGHTVPIGLAGRTPILGVSESRLREHFCSFIHPRNMFVVPTEYAGLAELPEMCGAIKRTCSAVRAG